MTGAVATVERKSEVFTIDTAQRDIAALDTLPALKEYFDKASALRQYTKQAGKDRILTNKIGTAMVRSAWKGGAMLRRVERSLGGRPEKNSSQPATSYQETLTAAGLARDTAHRWQAISHIPEDRLEQWWRPTK